ncbi:hypothetical protein G6732_00070 [Polynucleobacter paneuropaeus]|nr:hypothetical protein [Polynucleobacter paneuropaeus]
MRLALCSFAGGGLEYRESLLRLEREAISSGYFDLSYCFTDETAPISMRNEFVGRQDFYKERGFGYWSWKPQLIDYVLGQLDDGDILFYTDAGCQISSFGKKRFKDYVNFIEKNHAIFFDTPLYLEKSYTSKKIVDFLQISDDLLEQPQVQATFFGLKKSRQSLDFIEAWKKICLLDGGYYVNDLNLIPVDHSFIDYRHDQSILSLLVKLQKYPIITRECHHGSIEYYPNSSIMRFPIHSVRNRTGQTKDSHTFRYSSNKIVNSNLIFYQPIKLLFMLIYIIPKIYRFLKNRLKGL